MHVSVNRVIIERIEIKQTTSKLEEGKMGKKNKSRKEKHKRA